jgi:hypothetical protein
MAVRLRTTHLFISLVKRTIPASPDPNLSQPRIRRAITPPHHLISLFPSHFLCLQTYPYSHFPSIPIKMETTRDPPPPYSPAHKESTALLPPPTRQPRNAQPRHARKIVALILQFGVWFSVFVTLVLFFKGLFYVHPVPDVPVPVPVVRIAVIGKCPSQLLSLSPF